jgi:hypothetical protein
MLLTSTQNISGHDKSLGDWSGELYEWQVQTGDRPTMFTSVRKFATGDILLFDQHFPQEVTGSQAKGGRKCKPSPTIPHGGMDSDCDWLGLSSAFPTFQRKKGVAEIDLAFLEFNGEMINGYHGGIGPRVGLWEDVEHAKITPGLTAGPFALFDENGSNVAIISSHSNFMSASLDTTTDSSSLDFGVMGGASSIPAHFRMTHVLFVSDKGINRAFEEWGASLMKYYGKPRARARDEDATNKYLGYTTDNGAYYYYNPEEGKDYYGTLMDVYHYSVKEGIPYKNLLLDSWWYYQDPSDSSVILWEARGEVFPGGNAGMKRFGEETGWHFTAHNRYWSNRTIYDELSGGDFEFVHDEDGSPCDASKAISVPQNQNFWNFLFEQATSEWGLATYEQDWLYPQFLSMAHMVTNVTLARDWLMQMGNAATHHGLNIQYCMPLPRHAMQSVEVAAVTQIRVSDDYGPNQRWWQWRIGRSSILAQALGLGPSKDGIYTTRSQPGGQQGDFVESRPELELCVATMSTGPVQIADGVGYSDASLIMRSCSTDGTILKPSKAMTVMDFTLVDEAFGKTSEALSTFPNRSEIWSSFSEIKVEGEEGVFWFHVLAADLQKETLLKLSDVLATAPSSPSSHLSHQNRKQVSNDWLAYWIPSLDFDASRLSIVPLSQANASAAISLRMNKWSETEERFDVDHKDKDKDFDLWHFAPVMANGVSILGELSKWVPMSQDRVVEVNMGNKDVQVLVRGSPLEEIAFAFAMQKGRQILQASCTIPAGAEQCTITVNPTPAVT